MLDALLWTMTICASGAMGGATTIALLALYDWAQARVKESLALREAEQEMHLKALKSASREVE